MSVKKQHTISKSTRRSRERPVRRIVVIVIAVLMVAIATTLGIRYYQQVQAEKAAERRAQQMGLSDEPVTEEQRKEHQVDGYDKPKLLTIEKIDINNARIQEIGLMAPTSSGSQQMDAPVSVHDVGWFNCQINPVESKKCANYISPLGVNNTETAAVMDGHSCSGNGCVFDGLADLVAGDEIKVTMGDDAVVTYVVDEVEVVDLDDLDMKKAMSAYQPGKPGLNFITCDGSWSATDSRGVVTMNRRVVVYSSLSE